MKRALLLLLSHAFVGAVGFAAGIYILPILTAPPPASTADMTTAVAQARYQGEFVRSLRDSDALHWGEGKLFVGAGAIALQGRVAPGPDYKLYLSPEFVETEADFLRLKPRMLRVGEVKTFENFVVPLAPTADIESYNTVIVWCEAFGQFITSARYR